MIPVYCLNLPSALAIPPPPPACDLPLKSVLGVLLTLLTMMELRGALPME